MEDAINRASAAGLDGVRTHIEQAVALHGKRPEPDYRNAIKEAISAVDRNGSDTCRCGCVG